MNLLAAAHPLVHVNATLNTLATLLLLLGLVLIKQRKELAHKRAMLAALAASTAFLACYLYYHAVIGRQTPFTHEGLIRYVYWFILFTHVVLAMTVPPLAIWTILLGLRAHGQCLPARVRAATEAERQAYSDHSRTRHRRWARVTLPIWLYVSVTGVLVYLMLYHWWPSAAA